MEEDWRGIYSKERAKGAKDSDAYVSQLKWRIYFTSFASRFSNVAEEWSIIYFEGQNEQTIENEMMRNNLLKWVKE